MFCNHLHCQSSEFIEFDTFHVDVIRIPAKECWTGYKPHYRDYDIVKHLTWNKIDIPETDTKHNFPGLDYSTRIGFFIKSKMEVKKSGIYELCLTSDDGSRLWIDGSEMLNNDDNHKMRKVCDSIFMAKKENQDFELWYYQGFVDKYGLKFTTTVLPDSLFQNVMDTLSYSIYFDENSSNPDSLQIENCKEFMMKIKCKNIDSIQLSGFADSKGSVKYNYNLGMSRAESVKELINKFFACQSVDIKTRSFGENHILDDIVTSKNRRVELVVFTTKLKNIASSN